jgi:hypothetical protein
MGTGEEFFDNTTKKVPIVDTSERKNMRRRLNLQKVVDRSVQLIYSYLTNISLVISVA